VIKEYVRAGAFDVVERRKTDDANGKVPVTDGFHDRVTVPEISSKGNWRRKASLPRKPLLAIPVEIVEVERCIDSAFMQKGISLPFWTKTIFTQEWAILPNVRLHRA